MRADRGEHDAEVGRAHEAVVVDEEVAGQPGEDAREDEGHVLVAPRVVAEDLHAPLALADADQGAAEGRAHDEPQQGRRCATKQTSTK